jgi:hypothetical protein
MESPYANHQFTHLTNCTVWGGGRDSLFIDAGVTDTTIDRFVGGFFARRGIYHRGGNVKFLNCHPYCSVAAGAGTVCFYQDTGNLTQILGGQYESANIGIQLENVSDCLVRGANFYHYSGSPLTGCVLAHNSARVSVTDCQTYPVAGAAPNQGIVFNVVNGGVIAQNQLHGYQVGVKVDGGSTNITVADNVILGSSFTSIWVTNATRSTIHDNMVDTNSITEAAPSNYNIFHDNQLNGVTLTVVGANSAARNNMP